MSVTSSRFVTKGKFDQKFGRIVARIKIPCAQGLWGEFWMPGYNIGNVGWRACGEIDIMKTSGANRRQFTARFTSWLFSGKRYHDTV